MKEEQELRGLERTIERKAGSKTLSRYKDLLLSSFLEKGNTRIRNSKYASNRSPKADLFAPEEREFERLKAEISRTVPIEKLRRYLWLRDNISDIILSHAGKITEARMNTAFKKRSYEDIMREAVRVAKNRRRYRPPISIREIAERFHITELSLTRRLYQ